MSKLCSGCGYEVREGETFIIFVNPETDWWKTLFDLPQYCDKCAELKRNNIRGEKNETAV